MAKRKSSNPNGINIIASCKRCVNFSSCENMPQGENPVVTLNNVMNVEVDQVIEDTIYSVAIGYCERVGMVVCHDLATVPVDISTHNEDSIEYLRSFGKMPFVRIELAVIDPLNRNTTNE